MKKILLSGLIVFFGFLSAAYAQADWTVVAPAAFARLDAEVADSIAARRAECAAIREQMNGLMLVLGFEKDRALILGPEDAYFKEGMHLKFSSPPTGLGTHLERNPQMRNFEEQHAALYYNDRALYHWLELEKRLKKHPDREKTFRWPLRFQDLPVAERKKLQTPEACENWVVQDIVCRLAADLMYQDGRNGAGKVRDMKLKFKQDLPESQAKSVENWKLPFEPDKILYSFPINGQYAFWRDESIPGVGYVVFPSGTSRLLYDCNADSPDWFARWTSSTGQVIYTEAEHRDGDQIFFNLPERYFQPGLVYRLELLVQPRNEKTTGIPEEICWRVFRGQPLRDNAQSTAGSTKITELYFRCGKYSVRDKVKTMEGAVDWQRGAITFETDEPLDPLEMNGGLYFPPPVKFMTMTGAFYKIWSALDSKELNYYLTVPEVEALDQLPADQLAIAELDNTLDAPFVRKTKLGNYINYISVPDHQEQPYPLPGGYVAPVLSRLHAKDSLSTSKPVPVITRAHFASGKAPETGMVQCTLFVGTFQQLLVAASTQQQQIRRRMEERAQFFYQLEQRRAKRLGKPLTVTLEELRKQELENMPAEAKILLEAKFPDAFKPGFQLSYSRFFPGSTQRTTELLLKFD